MERTLRQKNLLSTTLSCGMRSCSSAFLIHSAAFFSTTFKVAGCSPAMASKLAPEPWIRRKQIPHPASTTNNCSHPLVHSQTWLSLPACIITLSLRDTVLASATSYSNRAWKRCISATSSWRNACARRPPSSCNRCSSASLCLKRATPPQASRSQPRPAYSAATFLCANSPAACLARSVVSSNCGSHDRAHAKRRPSCDPGPTCAPSPREAPNPRIGAPWGQWGGEKTRQLTAH